MTKAVAVLNGESSAYSLAQGKMRRTHPGGSVEATSGRDETMHKPAHGEKTNVTAGKRTELAGKTVREVEMGSKILRHLKDGLKTFSKKREHKKMK